MEQWLVISNCQTFGLANCLQAQVSDVQVTGVDTLLFNSDPDRFNATMDKYSTLFIADGVKGEIASARIDAIPDHVALPMVTCRVFHPDLVYLQHDGRPVVGPVGDYHSAIAYACFRAGMSVADTVLRFNGSFLERCGYMAMWLPERDRLVEDLATFGLDVAAPIRTWGRHEAFMFSINHPRIHVLHDIAAELLRAQGRPPFPGGIIPHDNLATGAAFAVYPEIGETLGVAGSYVFKDVGSYRPVDLEGFVAGCFASYERIGAAAIAPHPQFAQHVDYVAALL
ncbi:WcbI family polysaccharide biosynthesis putative acetyltransferase [Sphingomonas sanxanigenens]|uniref:Polysaccharide biosynthesis enzyme WcbI domain-containing protein n=1 Tax=Sphingomonas sanxanigenens DSM 19645 = NX02 TaxID=1123269 RepID=W0AJ50_9SPHN|nr:WcbI family polysaccharide biosynthesis putative acetyltransferase [Sphingomonas sanxanigenens]AHE56567.1 hypothetical protein NX02_24800 [Sphingomonas sanxanigenens DSM 19645 = NX02]